MIHCETVKCLQYRISDVINQYTISELYMDNNTLHQYSSQILPKLHTFYYYSTTFSHQRYFGILCAATFLNAEMVSNY